MSFANEIKREILENQPREKGRRRAQAYGMLLFGRAFSLNAIGMQTENRQVAQLYCRYIFELVGMNASVTTTHFKKSRGGGLYWVTVDDQEDRRRILEFFGHTPGEINLRIRPENLTPDTEAAFLAGVYLVCGNITDPEKGYHAELVVSRLKLKEDLYELLYHKPKTVVRRGAYVLYYKESEQIEDLLTLVGAVNGSLALMNVKIYKDFRNKANRVTNCETANIGKTVAAAAAQIEDIRLVMEHKGIDFLGDDLREVAILRLENPEMSLREIGEALETPISRSGINHRFQRLSRLAQEIRESGGE